MPDCKICIYNSRTSYMFIHTQYVHNVCRKIPELDSCEFNYDTNIMHVVYRFINTTENINFNSFVYHFSFINQIIG